MELEQLAASAITERKSAQREALVGIVLMLAALAILALTRVDGYVSAGGFFAGLGVVTHALWRLATYRRFVAWRYLLNNPPKVKPIVGLFLLFILTLRGSLWGFFDVSLETRDISNPMHVFGILCGVAFIGVVVIYLLRHSKPALYAFFGAVGLTILTSVAIGLLVVPAKTPFDDPGGPQWLIKALVITNIGAAVVAGLALFFGSLRAIFTFFTTVPIGGVWIGTSALVCVLSVMSGFETDLRDKILGSNAHIQITREEGDFVNWREVKDRIDKIPGVVASTPFAVSEVVIAANNNGQNVIIKGIDPKTVGLVTDLINDLEDKEAVDRMQPLVEDSHDRSIPQTPAKPGGKVLDPPPDDMPTGADPIDFSPTSVPPDDDDDDDRPDDDVLGTDPFGGDATKIVGSQDPPPPDMLSVDTPPIDYSEPDAIIDDGSVRVIDVPLEPLSRRTQSLPGILVGRELVKQTHLYTGEEVRVVSPLSDPSNPDATGTPIPFNRDYRVAGVFYTGMYEYDLKYVYVTLDSLQDFLDLGDAVDGIEVRITDPDLTYQFVPTDDGDGRIKEALGPGYRIVDWRELNRSLFSALKLEKIAMFFVLGIVILVASFSIVGNLIMVVVEKGREIALLKTLGASDVGVMQLFAIQGLFIGVIGTLLGVGTGLIACWAGKKFGLPLNPDVYYIDRLPIHVDPQSVMAAAAAGVVISIAATFYPAMLAARVRPAAGMRH
ncbi:MAG: ABC transporter permease [Myxococcota bacterium]|nr:ABC transporter permease [Deltaproteobacteria bacterium]MDQ3334730.1 ABC transporter permease [Myxococcota bacterium]